MADLMNCYSEPIHIPGKIQRHGFLLAVDTSANIKFCSENILDFLPVSAAEVLGQPLKVLDNFFKKKDQTDFFSSFISNSVALQEWEFSNPSLVTNQDQSFCLVISRSGNYFLLEFEADTSIENIDYHRLVGKSLSVILANTKLNCFLQISAQEIRKIIRYDRVMIYKFHDDGHGEVVAEDKEEDLSPFLGLHYPESDIPKQARELYKVNLVRLIADVHQKPSSLLTDTDPANHPLDLTNSILRAVSPVHIQYLKNMKVDSSFSISLIHQEKLWGLIACHNYSPHFIGYNGREAAASLAKVISSTLGYQQTEEDQQKKFKLGLAVETLAKQLSQSDSLKKALIEQNTSLLDAVNSTGAVLVIDNKIDTVGNTPGNHFLKELIQWLNETMQDQFYVSNRLPLEFPPAEKEKEICSGILAVRISKELNDFLIWLRPEVIANVNWGGNPDKAVKIDPEDNFKISPRKSFKKWTKKVLKTSLDWEKEAIDSALHLLEEVASSIIQKAGEIRRANEKLNEAYNTLDAFSYTISHDLKTPLTIINAYAQMLQEDLNGNRDAVAKVEGILAGTKKMDLMIRRILHYSQIGQSEVVPVRIKMDKLLSDICEDSLLINSQTNTEIVIENTPDIFADETMTMQVFSNLVTNAVKYSSKAESPKVVINGIDTGDYVVYTIVDNGIGIKEKDKETIFDLFTRSPDVTDFEGTGVGLSIVRRIMEKHGGKIWVESDGNLGSSFYVSFKKGKLNKAG